MLPRIGNVKSDNVEFMLFANKDIITNEIFRNGEWDKNSLIISKILYSRTQSSLILDIGANLGAYSIPVAKDIIESGGEIIAFEPQQIIYYQLCGNIILNRLDNVTAHNKAVGNYNGEIEIPKIDYANNQNAGAFSFHKEYREREGIESSIKAETSFVPILTLDSLPVPKPPALIKIDVEGYELDVFKSGTNFLKSVDFPPILFEVWNQDYFKEKREEVLGFVKNLGYDLLTLNQVDFLAQHKKHPLRLGISHQNADNVGLEWRS